jgi:hypothetical protein
MLPKGMANEFRGVVSGCPMRPPGIGACRDHGALPHGLLGEQVLRVRGEQEDRGRRE